MSRNPRQLHHLKSSRVKIGRGVPPNSEGSSGDLTVRMTKTGVKLFAKFRDKWYIVGQGNLHQVAGDDQDQLIDDNRKKISKFDPRGKLEIKDKGVINLHPWTIKSTKFDLSWVGAGLKGLQIKDTDGANTFNLGEDGTILFENTDTAYYPIFYIRNKKNTTGGPSLVLDHDHPDGSQEGFQSGTIYFRGTDAGANSHTYARIEAGPSSTQEGDERGFLRIAADPDTGADATILINCNEDGANTISCTSADFSVSAKLYLDNLGDTYLVEASNVVDLYTGGVKSLTVSGALEQAGLGGILTDINGGTIVTAIDNAVTDANNYTLQLSTTLNDTSDSGTSYYRMLKGVLTNTDITGWDEIYLIHFAGAGTFWVSNAGDLSIPAATKLYFDGGTLGSLGHTYIQESGDDVLDFYVGALNILKLTESGTDKVEVLGADLEIDSEKKMYLDGGGDTYLVQGAGDRLDLVAGGVVLLQLAELGGGASDKVIIPALTGLYFDGGGDTYIAEGSADDLHVNVGGDRMMQITEGGDNGNSCWFRANVAVGLARNEATFSATGVIGSGGTDDTDIDFRFGNKFRLEMTGDITNVNLIFPDMAVNCLLVCTTNGDHDVTNWKVYVASESAATGTDVLWPGGSVPAFTNNGIDIVSFYWDYLEQQCYGVASLAFAAP